ncbi:MAG: hypothetical protein MR605_09070, partial [Bacteroidales bacterium]|nr:hypothetical protein [Bacteroidales bacterium]
KAHSPGQATEGSGTPGYPGIRPCRPKGAKAFVRPHVTERPILSLNECTLLALHLHNAGGSSALKKKILRLFFLLCALLALLLPLWSDKAGCRDNPGCRLASLGSAPGWVLATPSGFCLERFLPTASFIPGGDGWPSIGVSLERFLPTDYITLFQVSQV